LAFGDKAEIAMISRNVGWRALFGRALGAVLGKEPQQFVHSLESRRVDHGAAFTPHRHETSVTEPVEMEGQGVRREFQGSGDAARKHSLWSGLDEQAKYVQAIFLPNRGQSRNRIDIFHISMIIEIWRLRQELFR
jgi:hypothetical protein